MKKLAFLLASRVLLLLLAIACWSAIWYGVASLFDYLYAIN